MFVRIIFLKKLYLLRKTRISFSQKEKFFICPVRDLFDMTLSCINNASKRLTIGFVKAGIFC